MASSDRKHLIRSTKDTAPRDLVPDPVTNGSSVATPAAADDGGSTNSTTTGGKEGPVEILKGTIDNIYNKCEFGLNLNQFEDSDSDLFSFLKIPLQSFFTLLSQLFVFHGV